MSFVLDLMDGYAGLRERSAVHRNHVVGLECGSVLDSLDRFEQEFPSLIAIGEKHLLHLHDARRARVLGSGP